MVGVDVESREQMDCRENKDIIIQPAALGPLIHPPLIKVLTNPLPLRFDTT